MTRRPVGFWSAFNGWWRGILNSQGRRPQAAEIASWYETFSDEEWGFDKPSLKETRIHAKCLRSTDEVRDYFRRYRAIRKEEDGDDSSNPKKRRGAVLKIPADSTKGITRNRLNSDCGRKTTTEGQPRKSNRPNANTTTSMNPRYYSELNLSNCDAFCVCTSCEERSFWKTSGAPEYRTDSFLHYGYDHQLHCQPADSLCNLERWGGADAQPRVKVEEMDEFPDARRYNDGYAPNLLGHKECAPDSLDVWDLSVYKGNFELDTVGCPFGSTCDVDIQQLSTSALEPCGLGYRRTSDSDDSTVSNYDELVHPNLTHQPLDLCFNNECSGVEHRLQAQPAYVFSNQPAWYDSNQLRSDGCGSHQHRYPETLCTNDCDYFLF